MRSLHTEFPVHSQDQATLRLAEAYRVVFSGESGEIVLADLAHHCKVFEQVPIAPGIDNTQVLIDFNGRRSVYGRILQFLRLSADELSDLERAAAIERTAERLEGTV